MNDRIQELAEQAGFTANDEQKIFLEIYEQELKKFTKLIVQECVRYFNEDYQRDFDTDWREDLSKGMKEHFGVE